MTRPAHQGSFFSSLVFDVHRPGLRRAGRKVLLALVYGMWSFRCSDPGGEVAQPLFLCDLCMHSCVLVRGVFSMARGN